MFLHLLRRIGDGQRKIDIYVAVKATKLSNFTSLLSFCRHITLHFLFLEKKNLSLIFFLYLRKYLSRECGLHKASDLLLGGHVCENVMLSSG